MEWKARSCKNCGLIEMVSWMLDTGIGVSICWSFSSEWDRVLDKNASTYIPDRLFTRKHIKKSATKAIYGRQNYCRSGGCAGQTYSEIYRRDFYLKFISAKRKIHQGIFIRPTGSCTHGIILISQMRRLIL